MWSFLESRPPVFIDTAGSGSSGAPNRFEEGYETFSELFDYIHSNYLQVGEIEGTRIFIRKDRLGSPIIPANSTASAL